jgi:hypothetical protein
LLGNKSKYNNVSSETRYYFMSTRSNVNLFIGFLTFGKKIIRDGKHAFKSENATLIKTSLINLLDSSNKPPYVTIVDELSGHIIQFARTERGKLYLNLPAKRFSAEELKRGKKILKPYRVDYFEEPLILDVGGRTYGDAIKSFSRDIDDDVDLAIELCSKIMFEVFQLQPGLELKIQ